MSMISYDEKIGIFQLDTMTTSYCIAIVDGCYAAHLYYGRKLRRSDLSYLLRLHDYVMPPSERPDEKTGFFEKLPWEYPAEGLGDYREPCLAARGERGLVSPELILKGWKTGRGKEKLPGLPSSFGERCETLELYLADEVTGLSVTLLYSVFEDSDALVRSAVIRNQGEEPVMLTRALSACLELPEGSGRTLTFGGTWAGEHMPVWREAACGGTVSESRRGIPGHGGQPFMGFACENGDMYAMHLIYSGGYLSKLSENAFGEHRMVIGIHPEDFEWRLEAGEAFYTPEAVLIFAHGTDAMTHVLHDFYRAHLIRDVRKERPLLINSWEAVYFDFTKERLLDMAEEAAGLGIGLLVLDDGWYGEGRMTASGCLGDWRASRKKLPGGLGHFSRELAKRGLGLGLWFEPEMISENSELYRAHPEWVVRQRGRRPGLCRDQWMLDLSRPEVRDYLYESMAEAIAEGEVRYIKWDMNRTLADAGSAYLPPDRQKELMHRLVLGVYEIQERLLMRFPELLIENCASGGARFDPGMLYMSPQIWCSDNMDPVERLKIHEGTAMLYPLSAIGSHVCKSPNDITGRSVPLKTRLMSAMFGTFGFELDVTALTEEEKEEVRHSIRLYRRLRAYIRDGDYYVLASAFGGGSFASYEVVSKDGLDGFVVFTQILSPSNGRSTRIRLRGLRPERDYRMNGKAYPGDALMNGGYLFPYRREDYVTELVEFHAV